MFPKYLRDLRTVYICELWFFVELGSDIDAPSDKAIRRRKTCQDVLCNLFHEMSLSFLTFFVFVQNSLNIGEDNSKNALLFLYQI